MADNKHTLQELQNWQSLPLNIKISMTKRRIRDWVNEFGEDGVYVSFSGGKDSTVLLHMAREMYPDIKAVFVDTGLEYPEIRQFVKTFDNVDIIRPKIGFRQVCEKYGFPLISKEVSECVYGARKYLTSILEAQSHLNERTNKQTNYAWCIADMIGVDRREVKNNPEYQALKDGNLELELLTEKRSSVRVRGGVRQEVS